MTIYQTVTTALKTVLANSWATELPSNVTFPAIVFDVESVPEQQWVLGGSYDQHTVGVFIYAKTLTELTTLKPLVVTALQTIEGYMLDGESGDAEYEEDASVYGFYTNHVIRLRQE